MTTGGERRILRHGTTRQRAEAILKDGPNPNFVEPGSSLRAKGFSTSDVQGPYAVGSPEQYAAGKASLFPTEGGPAILEVEVPKEIANLATDVGGEVRFEPGSGLRELLDSWPDLPKRILLP